MSRMAVGDIRTEVVEFRDDGDEGIGNSNSEAEGAAGDLGGPPGEACPSISFSIPSPDPGAVENSSFQVRSRRRHPAPRRARGRPDPGKHGGGGRTKGVGLQHIYPHIYKDTPRKITLWLELPPLRTLTAGKPVKCRLQPPGKTTWPAAASAHPVEQQSPKRLPAGSRRRAAAD